MPDSIISKAEKNPQGSNSGGIMLPVPGTLGCFIIFLTALAFIAGKVRNELALTLLGTVFLTILVYCFFAVFFLGLLNHKKAKRLSLTIVPGTIRAGKEAELIIKTPGPPKKNYFWSLPAILIRCGLFIKTNDGRVIRHYADPGIESHSIFPVRERGAYFGENDRLIIFDAPGFFRLSLALLPEQKTESQRLLAFPSPTEEPIRLSLKSGGTEQRNEPHYRKSDELTDHRPYVPGDDPRRINWKLYSHAPLGDLFVREGESQPPPRSRLLVLLDTETDPDLYTIEEGQRAVDMLCENALAASLEFAAQGMDILIGYTGGGIIGGKKESGPLDASELASALAWPAAIFSGNKSYGASPKPEHTLPIAELPKAPADRAVLILALPRSTIDSALDLFLRKREAGQRADIVFLYDAESRRAAELEANAITCVNFFNRKTGVRAERIIWRGKVNDS